MRGKDRQILPGPHPALSAPLRLFMTVAPIPVHNAARVVEGLSWISPKSLRSMRPLPYYMLPARIPIGALSAKIIESSLPVMDGRDT